LGWLRLSQRNWYAIITIHTLDDESHGACVVGDSVTGSASVVVGMRSLDAVDN